MRPSREPSPAPRREAAEPTLPPPYDCKSEEEWVDSWSTTLLSLPLPRASLLLLLQHADASSHRSLSLHVLDLALTHPLHARFLLDRSTTCIPLINRGLGFALRILHAALTSNPSPALPLPPLHLPRLDRVHVRPFYLPSTHFRSSINAIRAQDTGSLISVTGSVTRVHECRLYEYAAQYQCDRCHGRFYVYADEDAENRIELPSACCAYLQPEANADNAEWLRQRKPCRSPLIHPTSESLPRDVQLIRLQEALHRSQFALPRSIVVRLTDDLCERVKTGDVVHVCGMVRRQWGPLIPEQRVNVEPYLDAYHLDVVASSSASAAAINSPPIPVSEFQQYWAQSDARGLRSRNHIVNCIAPSLVGLFLPKLACLLALIGGVKKEDRGEEEHREDVEEKAGEEGEEEKGLQIRGDIHILLVGDAGVGKSVLLSSASLISPRGVLTTGTGTTTAGLTVAAVRSQSRSSAAAFTLEPGALVLADGGVCCIDEFNLISKHDRPAVLEAMEQQTISVAKGGVVTTLSTRTSVIAALNPRGRFDPDVDLSVNTALSSPLLSRFDVILVLLDTSNDEWDEKLAQHLLMALPSDAGSRVKKQEVEEGKGGDDEDSVIGTQSLLTQQSGRGSLTQLTTVSHLLTRPWTVQQMQAYITHVKTRFFPTLSSSSQQLLTRYYQLQRRSGGMKQARINIRMLESLVRLTQAHARLMYRDECLLLDAVMAVMVMEHSALSCGLLAERRSRSTAGLVWSSAAPVLPSALHLEFSQRPEEEYDQWEATILGRLGMQDETRPAGPPRRLSRAPSTAPRAPPAGAGAVSFAAVSAAGMAVASLEAASVASSQLRPMQASQRPEPVRRVPTIPLPTPPLPSRPQDAAPLSRPPEPIAATPARSSAPPLPSPPNRAGAPVVGDARQRSSAALHAQPSMGPPAQVPSATVTGAERLPPRGASVASPSPSPSPPPTGSAGSAADPYTLPSQPSSQGRRPAGNPFGASPPPPPSSTALPAASTAAPHAAPPAPSPRLTTAPPSASSSAHPRPLPHPRTAPPLSRPVPPSPAPPPPPTSSPKRPSAAAVSRPPVPPSFGFSTPLRSSAAAAASLTSPPPLQTPTSAVTPPSLASPLSSLAPPLASARKDSHASFSAVALPSSFAAAVKFANPFAPSHPASIAYPAPKPHPEPPVSASDAAFTLPDEVNELDGAQWLAAVPDDVINGLDLGL